MNSSAYFRSPLTSSHFIRSRANSSWLFIFISVLFFMLFFSSLIFSYNCFTTTPLAAWLNGRVSSYYSLMRGSLTGRRITRSRTCVVLVWRKLRNKKDTIDFMFTSISDALFILNTTAECTCRIDGQTSCIMHAAFCSSATTTTNWSPKLRGLLNK